MTFVTDGQTLQDGRFSTLASRSARGLSLAGLSIQLLVLGWLIALTPGLPGQARETESPLQSLEQQRVLFRSYRQACEANELKEAALICGRFLELPQLVTFPGQDPAVSPREALCGIANDILVRAEKKIWERSEAQQKLRWGKPCSLCEGKGSFVCTRCQGSGVQKRGRRTIPCHPFFPCLDCRGSGRQGSPPVRPALERISKAVQAILNSQADLIGLLKAALGGLPKDLDAMGYREAPGPAAALVAVVPQPPFQPQRLTAKARRGLKKGWEKATCQGRRAFLRWVILESLAFAEEASCLSVPGSTLKKDLREAVSVSPVQLCLETAKMSGKFFKIRVQLGDEAAPAHALFPSSTLSVRELNPELIEVHDYDDAGRKRLEAARRLGLIPALSPLIQSYPFKKVSRELSKLQPGAHVELTGRLLLRPGLRPSRIFELWQVAALEGGQR